MIYIGTPYRHNSGYYLNDKELGRRRQEDDVQTCNHCQAVIRLRFDREHVAICMGCMRLTCGPCSTRALTYGCEPFVKKIDQQFDALYKLEQHLKVAGLEPALSRSLITL